MAISVDFLVFAFSNHVLGATLNDANTSVENTKDIDASNVDSNITIASSNRNNSLQFAGNKHAFTMIQPSHANSLSKRNLYPTITFFVIGDVPYTKQENTFLRLQLKQITTKDGLFLVHVGDLMSKGNCKIREYRSVARTLFMANTLPTIVLPGDNDWIDCPNRTRAFNKFKRFFVENNDSVEGLRDTLGFERQGERSENFAMFQNKVLFLGLNVSHR